jgi:hypothetical protein
MNDNSLAKYLEFITFFNIKLITIINFNGLPVYKFDDLVLLTILCIYYDSCSN